MAKLAGRVLIYAVSYYCSFLYAAAPSQMLQEKLGPLHTMTAHFTQVVQTKHRIISRSEGTMALKRPGKFKWNTLRPMEQLVVANGKTLCIYDKDLEQVTLKKQEKGMGGTAGLFLSGYDDTLIRDFNVIMKPNAVFVSYTLIPKNKEGHYSKVTLTFKDNLLVGMLLHDPMGQKTVIHLSDIKMNVPIDKIEFKCTYPKGVDIIKQ